MRFRLYPTAIEETILSAHCRDARYVWNLALEQANMYRPGRPTPGNAARNRQLTEARAAFPWLAAGSVMVQQQALRDFDQAMRKWWAGTHGRPTWRKKGEHEGFRAVTVQPAHVQRLNRRWGQVLVPKVGMVRFRWTRQVPADAKSYRVTHARDGRWHVAFAVKPAPIDGPGTGEVVGIDRGVALTLACSDGSTYSAPKPLDVHLHARRLSRAKQGSNRRQKAKLRVAKDTARDADRRKDFVEKASTDLARRFDLIRIEDLRIKNMVRSARGTVDKPGRNVAQKRGLNRAILANAWGLFASRLEDKAPGRVEKVNPAYTSQTCSACGHVDRNSRESQAKFLCTACGYAEHADVNAARNIAAGHAVTGRGGIAQSGEPTNRQPQPVASG